MDQSYLSQSLTICYHKPNDHRLMDRGFMYVLLVNGLIYTYFIHQLKHSLSKIMQEDQRTLTEDQIYRLDGNSGATVVVYVLSDFPF